MRNLSLPEIFRSDPFRGETGRRFEPDRPEVGRRRIPDLWWLPLDGDNFLCVDEYVEDGNIVVRVDAPGIDPNADIDLRLTDGQIDLRVARQERTSTEDVQHRRSEVRYGKFRRTLPVPRGTSADQINASYNEGVLEIRIPTNEALQAEKIEISNR